MPRSRAASYLGFARRAGKLSLGLGSVQTLRRCDLLVADRAAGKTSRERIERIEKKLSCPLVWCEGLGEMVGRPGCVIAAVRDEQFARAVREVLDGQTGQEERSDGKE